MESMPSAGQADMRLNKAAAGASMWHGLGVSLSGLSVSFPTGRARAAQAPRAVPFGERLG
jgi:hypothetical protein